MRSNSPLGTVLRGILYSPAVTPNILRVLWVLLICWGELGVYFWSLSTCKWPVHKTTGDGLHVLLISDAQVSIPSLLSTSTTLFLRPRSFFAEKFLKKSWYATSRLDPQVVFFLGDMLSDGRSVENEAQYTRHFQKFTTMFPLHVSTAVFYLPGNNDVGIGLASARSRSIRKYYQKHFGTLNTGISLRNHTFFALDAPGLVDEDYQRNAHGTSFDRWEPIPGGVVDAVRNVATQNHDPLILLSHIPLYRPEGAYCGPLRESGTINRGAGHGYQNTLGKQTTSFLMEALEPSVIFSGGNRDYCEYWHKGTEESIPEITVKSFSPAPQIRRPGFQLVSIIVPTGQESSQRTKSLLHRPCLLPNTRFIYFGYMGWTFTMLCILLILNVQHIRRFRLLKPINRSLTPSLTWGHPTSPSFQDITNDSLSSVWPPHTPFPLITPNNPQSRILSTFRTPMEPVTPTFQASSRLLIPQGFSESPMPRSQLMPPMDTDEDSMFPDQCVIQRDARYVNDKEWMLTGRVDDQDSDSFVYGALGEGPQAFSSPSPFISAPENAPMHEKPTAWRIVWSWTFVIGGRRRQFVLFCAPRLSVWRDICAAMLEILTDANQRTLLRRRRGIIASTLIESISVFWPAGVTWLVINCWIF